MIYDLDFSRRSVLKAVAASPLAATAAGAVGATLLPGSAFAIGPTVPVKCQLIWGDDFKSFDASRWKIAPDGWPDRYGDIVGWDPNLVSVNNSLL